MSNKDSRNFCTICDAEVFLSADHRVVQHTSNRVIVVDGERAHILLVGVQKAAAFRALDARAHHSEVLLAYKQPEVIEPPVEAQDEDAPLPLPEDETTAQADGTWFEELMVEDEVQ